MSDLAELLNIRKKENTKIYRLPDFTPNNNARTEIIGRPSLVAPKRGAQPRVY